MSLLGHHRVNALRSPANKAKPRIALLRKQIRKAETNCDEARAAKLQRELDNLLLNTLF
jgi:hypothetical protein